MISQAIRNAVLLLCIAALCLISAGAFSLPGAQQTMKDTVYVTPLKPTTKDSLHFDLFNVNLDCCTQYYNKTASVSDTTILLSFEYVTNPACACLIAGSHTAFSCGPQRAGKYAIYKEQSVYCGTPPCPLNPGPIQLVRVGQVTVGATAVSRMLPAAPTTGGPAVRQERNTVFMEYALEQPSHVRLNVFNARGMLVGQLYNGQAGAGTRDFSWTAAAQGVYFLSVEIDGVAPSSRRIVISR